MRLPDALDTQAVDLCAAAVRQALSVPRFDHLPAEERRQIVANGVEKMMAAGAFVRGGKLYFPRGVTAADL